MKATTFWYGPSDKLNDLIQGDQNNLRLALDPYINLFDWITQPEISSTRQDIDSLFSYWAKRLALITDPDMGKKLKLGGGFQVNHFSADRPHPLFVIQWQEFKKWQSTSLQNRASAFSFRFAFPQGKNALYGNLKGLSPEKVAGMRNGIGLSGRPRIKGHLLNFITS